jgi:hypothetical protein
MDINILNTTYTACKGFVSTVSLEDLVKQINEYCINYDKELQGISHCIIENQNNNAFRSTHDSAPIYNRVFVYTAIVYYTNRH